MKKSLVLVLTLVLISPMSFAWIKIDKNCYIDNEHITIDEYNIRFMQMDRVIRKKKLLCKIDK